MYVLPLQFRRKNIIRCCFGGFPSETNARSISNFTNHDFRGRRGSLVSLEIISFKVLLWVEVV